MFSSFYFLLLIFIVCFLPSISLYVLLFLPFLNFCLPFSLPFSSSLVMPFVSSTNNYFLVSPGFTDFTPALFLASFQTALLTALPIRV